MSQANNEASFAKKLITAATAAGDSVGISELSLDLDNPDAEPYPSVRLFELGDDIGDGEGCSFLRVSVRLPRSLGHWGRTRFREELRKELGINLRKQSPRESLVPGFDYQASDNPSASGAEFRIELAGSKVWGVRWESYDIQHCWIDFKIYFQGD